MGMSVNTNIAAMNAYRNLSSTNDAMSKSLERLSSGFRINRAADDAAGLAISGGLKSQIGGLTQAVRNTQDGTSVTQSAEGALNETTSILQRMRDLSVQASNDGGLNSDAKTSIQKEMGQLKEELSRIANTTTFNGTKLLDGSYNKSFQVGANAGETISVAIGSTGKGMDAAGLGLAGVDVTTTGVYSPGAAGTGKVDYTTAANKTTAAVMTITAATIGGTQDDFTSTTLATAKKAFTNLTGVVSFGGKSLDLSSVKYTDTDADGSGTIDKADYLRQLNDAAKTALGLTGMDNAGTPAAYTPFTATAATTLTFKVQEAVGGYTGANGVALNAANAASSSADEVSAATPKFTAGTGASDAITKIDDAIKLVSSVRADLGAKQNRFEHTINNLNVAIENTTSSNSRIRDTDMAAEMTKFTRSQVLTQAGTSMLAQANQSTQSILKLLG
jgi:flagellin-like hook-associated protein FlgL